MDWLSIGQDIHLQYSFLKNGLGGVDSGDSSIMVWRRGWLKARQVKALATMPSAEFDASVMYCKLLINKYR